MPLRSLFARLLLALLLVVTGEQAVLHELHHAFEQLEGRNSDDAPRHAVCANCVAFSSVHNLARTAHAPPPVLPFGHARPADVPFRSADCGFVAAYLSRAPPRVRC